MMNRESEEQRPIAQTLCGALQREPNCKCLLLSLLIYICIAAVTWCRCTNVTKLMVNYAKFPIRSSKQITSPCDEGYIYIPVAFMGMLYLVYLVECYHSPIRIDLLHAESQDSVLSKLAQLKTARPTIWWRAVSYHYARRKRQITRYRNGDNYITTQVYYERVNTHVATSSYYYHYCGVKDISKDLVLGSKIPITKIMLTKGFAFSNMTSATEFEEIRSRFFAEQELRDDYLEMREGLDIGNNVNSTMLVAVLGNPWFTNRYVYWCLSALLLSWPLRVIIEYKTQYVDYQVTKLFGVNYDTPTSGEPIHASMSQLSQPGSYMLAPSYSEALLMDPAPSGENQENWQAAQNEANVETDMVPSYSEALLYERAEQLNQQQHVAAVTVAGNSADATTSCNIEEEPSEEPILTTPCEYHCPCPCHSNTTQPNSFEITRVDERSYIEIRTSSEHLPTTSPSAAPVSDDDSFESRIAKLRTTADGRLHPSHRRTPRSMDNLQNGASPSRCGSCGRMSTSTQTINSDELPRDQAKTKSGKSSQTPTTDFGVTSKRDRETLPSNISEPNLRSRSEPMSAYAKENVKSLENILENEEEPMRGGKLGYFSAEANPPNGRPHPGHHKWTPRSVPPSLSHSRSLSLDEESVSRRAYTNNRGAIPKADARSRITINPISNEACWKLPNSKTYFCLKSILKQNRRRYTLVTADEYQNQIADQNASRASEHVDGFDRGKKPGFDRSDRDVWADNFAERSRMRQNFANPRRRMPSFEEFMVVGDRSYAAGDQSREGTRTLIFASPLQKIPPSDPFGGKDLVPGRSSMERNVREDPSATPVLARLGRSPADRDRRRIPEYNRHRRVFNAQQEHPPMHPFHHSHTQHPHQYLHQHQHPQQHPLHQYRLPSVESDRTDDFPASDASHSYRGSASLPPHNSRFSEHPNKRSMMMTSGEQYDRSLGDRRPTDFYSLNRRHQCAGLTRSFTERRPPKIAHVDRNFRRSFTGRVEDYRAEDYRAEDYRAEDYRAEDYRMDNARRMNFSMETSL